MRMGRNAADDAFDMLAGAFQLEVGPWKERSVLLFVAPLPKGEAPDEYRTFQKVGRGGDRDRRE